MGLNEMPDNEKLLLCRKYFYMGIFCLPLLWFVNTIWFFPTAFINNPFPNQKLIRKYVAYSMVGSIVWIIAIISWIVTFQLKRASWDQFGDYLSFNIPRGIP